jgi:hypothetical protein
MHTCMGTSNGTHKGARLHIHKTCTQVYAEGAQASDVHTTCTQFNGCCTVMFVCKQQQRVVQMSTPCLYTQAQVVNSAQTWGHTTCIQSCT